MKKQDTKNEGRDRYMMDIDRMINEGLGGGQVTMDNGLMEETTEIKAESKPMVKSKKD